MPNKIAYTKLDIKRICSTLTWAECNMIIKKFNELQRNSGYWGRQTPDCQLAKAFIDVCKLDIQTDAPDDQMDNFTPPKLGDIVQNGELRPVEHDEHMVGVAKELLDFEERTCPVCHKVCADKAKCIDHVRGRHASKFPQYAESIKDSKKNK